MYCITNSADVSCPYKSGTSSCSAAFTECDEISGGRMLPNAEGYSVLERGRAGAWITTSMWHSSSAFPAAATAQEEFLSGAAHSDEPANRPSSRGLSRGETPTKLRLQAPRSHVNNMQTCQLFNVHCATAPFLQNLTQEGSQSTCPQHCQECYTGIHSTLLQPPELVRWGSALWMSPAI